ncbi:MAG: GlxA family transcriptional regulator [Pseudomonadales bacterium]
MDTNIEKTATSKTPRQVVMVTYPQAHILDVVGPIEVLTGVKLFAAEQSEPYTVSIVAASSGPIETTCGIPIQADNDFVGARDTLGKIDTLIVAGGHGTTEAMQNAELLNFVKWAAEKAQRVVSICTGAMILAEVGLLDHRRATTHWFWCPTLAKNYPNVTVEGDSLFVRDGKIWTSAGVTAGMDLSLALIEEDWGHDIALQVARYNVMYMMRPGGQSQFSAELIAQQAEDSPLKDTLDYIRGNCDQNLTVTALAARAFMSERSFARKFKDAVDMTPAQYVELARLQEARVALEQSDESIEIIALKVGFTNPERMRRAFQRHLGIAATEYRQRFQSNSALAPATRRADPQGNTT